MRILITNDDGINSSVLPDFIRWAMRLGDVTVVVPAVEQSGKSQAIDFRHLSKLTKVDLVDGAEVYSLDSTPADCVRFAVLALNKQFDIVFSGINHGYNLGEDISYSGTVGAAFEASRLGIRSIAFSTDFSTFEYALKHIDKAYDFIINNDLFSISKVYNVNFPTVDPNGIKITRQGGAFFSDNFEDIGGGVYRQFGDPMGYEGDDTIYDIHAMYNGYISITPLIADRTDVTAFETLRNKYN